MVAFFSGLFSAIAAIPPVLAFVQMLLDAANEAMYQRKAKQAGEQFDKGAEKARKDKNTCELERAFNPDKKCD